MTKKLNPCPFCGGEAKLYSVNNRVYRIYYDNEECFVQPDVWHYRTFANTVQKWNTRSFEPVNGK